LPADFGQRAREKLTMRLAPEASDRSPSPSSKANRASTSLYGLTVSSTVSTAWRVDELKPV
jgi:hypothetical protein